METININKLLKQFVPVTAMLFFSFIILTISAVASDVGDLNNIQKYQSEMTRTGKVPEYYIQLHSNLNSSWYQYPVCNCSKVK